MSSDSSDITEIQKLDACLSLHIRGKKFEFAQANACVAKAQNGPPIGYGFSRSK